MSSDCLSCGRANRAGARFCDACGVALAAAAPASADDATRKVVTIVFADLVGSTALHERLDPESARSFMERYYRAMEQAVQAHGGIVTQLLGDGVMAVFGTPRVAEDDGIRAVRAAVAMQQAFRELARAQSGAVGQIGLRVAVNTGEVIAGESSDIIGDPVNVAARLQAEARDGDVVIGEATERLVAGLVTLTPLGSFALKGRSEAVAAYRVVSLDRPAGATAIAFVGREEELARLTAVYQSCVAAPGARLAVILGSPGLGKSRLIAELARRLARRASVLVARCDAAGGATFAPLAEALRTLLRVDDGAGIDTLRTAIDRALPRVEAERARVVEGIAALLAASPASADETFYAVRRFLTAIGTTQPVVLAIDDVQWAEPLLLDLTEHLAQWASGVPLLVLLAARPELRDTRPALTSSGGHVADVVTLTGLDAAAATRLAASVIGAAQLPAAVAGRVLATSEGNPLFVGELVRMLVHDGALKREGNRWTTTVELADLEMPPTIHALLAARIERLRPEERLVLERAAVVGRQFSRAAVANLLPRDTSDLDARLDALRRSDLIEPDVAWFAGEPALRFHHVLIRDAAYRRLLKGTRAELHGRLADWLEDRVGGSLEHDETIGWHLEQAHQCLTELGPLDAQGRAFGERAARHLASAGRSALARDDLTRAALLLGRALDRLEAGDSSRAALLLDRCEALLAAGEVAAAAGAIDELGRCNDGSDRLRAWHACFAGELAVLSDPQALRTTAAAVARAAAALAAAGDATGEAKAHSVHAAALSRLGEIGACEAALDRALAAARRGHDQRRASAVLAGAPLAALWGPNPVTRASGRCLDVVRVLRITQGAPAVEAVALRCQAVLEALRGRTAAARRMIGSSRRMVEELGITQRLLEADHFAGLIELLDGDAAAAERWLRGAYEGLRRLGLGIDAAQAAALLGRALLAQGRAAEAEAVSHDSEALAGDDLKAAIAWRGVRAEALAQRGEHGAAIELARAAVDIAAATDALLDHADARRALASALRAAGREVEADAEEGRAFELWDAKGASLLTARLRRGPRAAAPAPQRDTAAPGARRIGARLRPNQATAYAARLDAAIAARDLDALCALLDDDSRTFHHPTGVSYDRAGTLDAWQQLLAAEHVSYVNEPLATLGDRLALCRRAVSFGALATASLEFGAMEQNNLVLTEVGADGRQRSAEFFAGDKLADAVARLYQRYAELLPEGPDRARAAGIARAVAIFLGPLDPDLHATTFAPELEFVDRRLVGFGSASGADAVVRGLRALLEVAGDVVTTVDEVIELRPDALVVRWISSGTDRVSGGAYERRFIQLRLFRADALLARVEWFDVDREREALARLDQLTGAAAASSCAANAATRSMQRFEEAWAARDWDGMAAVFAPRFQQIDRRTMVHLDLDRDAHLRFMRAIWQMSSSHFTSQILATRGDRLVLARGGFAGTDRSIGPSEIQLLMVVEVDASGAREAMVLFDPEDLEAAYAELEARFAAGEAAGHRHVWAWIDGSRTAFAAHDWPAFTELLAADLVVDDHRMLGWGTLRGPTAYLEALRSLVELAPDARFRVDHAAMTEHALLWVAAWSGTREGGAFEAPHAVVVELDEQGRVRRMDQYDLDELDEARHRFAALGMGAHGSNAATAAMERLQRATEARDWDAMRALCAPQTRVEDLRRHVQYTGDAEWWVADAKRIAADVPDARFQRRLVVTAGDRVALERVVWHGTTPDGGPFEVEYLWLVEVDASGRIALSTSFDLESLDVALARLRERAPALTPARPGS